jgi:cytochrome b6
LFYYQPTETGAHESVLKIMTEVPNGWLVRSMHVWGASVFIAAVGLHLLTVLLARAYRRPRELVWISGMLMLLVVMGSGFSGYLLPWNELSYYATRVGTQIPGKLPVVGPGLVRLLRGGDQLTGDTITRFFAAHVLLAPAALGLLLTVHVFVSRVRGVSLPIGMSERDVKDRQPFFSEFLLIDVCLWLVIFGTIVTLAVVHPAEIGIKADPLKPAPEGIKPEWYFLFMFQTLKLLPETAAMLLFFVIGAFLAALPFLDRAASRGEKSLRFTGIFALLLAYVAAFQVLAAFSPGARHPAEVTAPQTMSTLHSVVSLVFLWSVIGFLIFYLRQLLRENARVRRLYRPDFLSPANPRSSAAPGCTPRSRS